MKDVDWTHVSVHLDLLAPMFPWTAAVQQAAMVEYDDDASFASGVTLLVEHQIGKCCTKHMMAGMGMPAGDVVRFFNRLDDIGLGRYIKGSWGHPTRVELNEEWSTFRAVLEGKHTGRHITDHDCVRHILIKLSGRKRI